MNENDVRGLFERYAANKGKAARFEAEIEKLDAEIAKIRALESDPLGAQVMDGMPKRKGGKSDPTGSRAVKLADGESVSKEGQRMIAKRARLSEELTVLRFEVATVDGWLDAMMERERIIIYAQLICGRSWREVADEYEKRFGDAMSDQTLRRMRDRTIAYISMQM